MRLLFVFVHTRNARNTFILVFHLSLILVETSTSITSFGMACVSEGVIYCCHVSSFFSALLFNPNRDANPDDDS